MILLLLLQAAALPDIQLDARVQAKSVTIVKQGDARLTVTASADGGNLVDVRAPAANGRKTLRDVDIAVHAEARIAAPDAPAKTNIGTVETPPPEGR